jgi:hypothetical protein
MSPLVAQRPLGSAGALAFGLIGQFEADTVAAIKDLETLRARLRVLCIQTRTSPGSRMDPNQAPKEPPQKPDSKSPLADIV